MLARGHNSNWSDEINKKKVKLGEKPIHIRAGRFEEVQASGNSSICKRFSLLERRMAEVSIASITAE
jgi:hypothetical protein